MSTDQTINYDDQIALQTQFFTFINTVQSGTKAPCAYRTWLLSWENWKVKSSESKTGTISFKDLVRVENVNYKGQYLSGFALDSVVTQPMGQDYEVWEIVSASNPDSTASVTTGDEFYLKLNKGDGTYISGQAGAQTSIPLNPNVANAMKFRMILRQQ